MADQADNSNLYSFLLSSERSGSNLFLRLLGAHADVCAPSPTHLFPTLAPNLPVYGDLGQAANWHALVGDAVALHAAGFGKWQSNPTIKGLKKALSRRSLGEILREIFTAEMRCQGKTRLFIKAHQAYNYVEFLKKEFPLAKYVYLVRDPRDMALSWKNTAGLRGGIMRAASIWNDEQQQLLDLSANLAADHRMMTVKYENLLADPSGELGQVCKFLGIEFSRAMLDFHLHESARDDARRLAAWRNLARPVIRSNSGKYRTELTWQEIQYVESVCEKPMSALGYVPESRQELDMDALRQHLAPREPWDKDGYDQLPKRELAAHARFRRCVERIKSRQPTKAEPGDPS
jgi:hypothetical protein